MAAGRITTNVAGGVARVVLDNPGRKNAITQGMWRELRHVFTSLAYEPDVRTVVLSGAGGLFSAGADLSEFPTARKTAAQTAEYSELCQAATDAILALPVPVVAQISGPCLGAGAAIALCADLRYMSEAAVFGIPAAKLGLAFEHRWLTRMIDTIGVSSASELLFTAKTFTAGAAQRMGFAHEVLPDGDVAAHVTDLAEGIAALAPLTLRAAKAGLRAAMRDDAQAGVQADALVTVCAESHDSQRALSAFATKERPEFQGD